MNKAIFLAAIALLVAGATHAQGQVVTTGAPNPKLSNGAPSGSCGPQDTAVDTTTGNFYTCKSGAWQLVSGGGGGSGTVNSGTAGQVSYYAANGTTVSGNSGLTTDSNGDLIVKNGAPWVDVLAYNADPTGTSDNSTAFTNAIAALGSTGGTIHVPCPKGTACKYIFNTASGGFGISPTSGAVWFIADPGVIFQAATGFTANNPIGFAGPSAGATVRFIGGTYDCGSLARGIQVQGYGEVYVDGVEIRDNCQYSVLGYSMNLIQVSNSFIHNNAGTMSFYPDTPANTTVLPVARILNTHFDSLNGGATAGTGLHHFEVKSCLFTNISGNQAALYHYAADEADWQNNKFVNVSAAAHCDACGGGNVSWNQSINATGNGGSAPSDFEIEISAHFTIEGNTSYNSAFPYYQIIAGVGGNTQGPAQLRSQIFSFDSTTGFTAGTNVTLSTDSSDKQEGTGSMVATANASFSTGPLWYNNFGSVQSLWDREQEIWLKPTSGSLAAGQLALVCSQNTGISTQDLYLPLPAVGQNVWLRVIAPAVGWARAVTPLGRGTLGFKSCGITVTTSSPSLVVKFDDYTIGFEEVGMVVKGNHVILPAQGCFDLGATQNAVVEDNDCYGATSGHAAYANTNSPGTVFTNNRSFFQVGTTGTIHLQADATTSASSIIDSGSTTNAGTYFSSVNGGYRTSASSVGVGPTCSFTSGGGTSPSCALQAGSTDDAGTIILTTGTGSPGSSGTLTLTFSAPYGTNPPTCMMVGSGTGAGQWSARVSFLDNNASATSDVQSWDNSGFVLSASTAYRVNYRCYAK